MVTTKFTTQLPDAHICPMLRTRFRWAITLRAMGQSQQLRRSGQAIELMAVTIAVNPAIQAKPRIAYRDDHYILLIGSHARAHLAIYQLGAEQVPGKEPAPPRLQSLANKTR